jgi:Carboxypeptidase regulatory-like domain
MGGIQQLLEIKERQPMSKKWLVCLAVLTFAVGFALSAFAQESAVKGAISGVVLDTTGAAVPGAKVTLLGPMGTRETVSDASGTFVFATLIPGFYSVRTEKENFKAATVSDIQVLVDHTSSIRVTLEPGAITQTINVTAAAEAVDTTSAAITSNYNATFYQLIPIQRNVTSLFYIAPGVKSGLGSGQANPSIAGGSGLENQYIADGVSITDTAFGGLGIYSREFGSLGTGLDLSFIQEVDVKTGGDEPQYGGSTGGIVQIVTKSGGREFHGGISAFYAPQQFEEAHRNADDPQFNLSNLHGKLVHLQSADLSGELGGYVPHFRNHLFFFGAMDPSENMHIVTAPITSSLAPLGDQNLRLVTYNYDAKLTFRINDNHTVEGSVFGDPTHSNKALLRSLIWGAAGSTPDTRVQTSLTYGDRDWAVRYNGTLSPTWLVNGSFTWMHNKFTENFNDIYRIINFTQTSGLPGQLGEFNSGGPGFVENTDGETFKGDIATSKIVNFWGSHNFSVGASLWRDFYDGVRIDSGQVVPLPDCGSNPNCDPSQLAGAAGYFGALSDWLFGLSTADSSCTLCPLMNIPGYSTPQPVYLFTDRSEVGLNSSAGKTFATNSTVVSSYINDSWTINKYLTINAGLRWEDQRIDGPPVAYSFTGNWEPRIGIVIDPKGDRKNKIYAGFTRFGYYLPLDLAERVFSGENDLFSYNFAPAFTVNASGQRIVTLDSFGAPIPIVDSNHIINTANGGVSSNASVFSSTGAAGVAPGTKMSTEDEWTVGAEHQFPHGVVLSARYIRRDLKRIVEDSSGIPPEFENGGPNFTTNGVITDVLLNESSTSDVFTNPIEFVDRTPGVTASQLLAEFPQCTGGVFITPVVGVAAGQGDLGGACFAPLGKNGQLAGSPVPDGAPDGFVDPVRQYWAVEFEVNKAFSSGWMLRANWTISRLFGNFEGAFRNDNGQSDPGISSLFDFTQGQFGLLGGQFTPGLLNTDRTHVVNIYATYVFQNGWKKGLTLGTGIKYQTGVPETDLLPHPVYLNAGEVPNPVANPAVGALAGGRGGLGRSSPTGTVDFHADYPIRLTERQRLHFGVDLFNLADSRRLLLVNQSDGLQFTGTAIVPNLDFTKPVSTLTGTSLGLGDSFVQPFSARVFARWEF